MFKLKLEPNGPVRKTKKEAYIRKFFVPGADGSKSIITVYSDDATKVAGDGPIEMIVRPSTDFYFAA